jgi:hypothetical protein
MGWREKVPEGETQNDNNGLKELAAALRDSPYQ